MSCANADEAAIVSPATTARIVAKATAATNAVSNGPPSFGQQRRGKIAVRLRNDVAVARELGVELGDLRRTVRVEACTE